MLVDQVGRKNIKVSVLKPFERNPRRISEDAFNQLKKSFSESFYHQRIIATEDLRVIGGHQRIISSFAIVRANVSSTSLPSATRYQTSVANSSRCSNSRKHHAAASR
jgi:hypothetical protein